MQCAPPSHSGCMHGRLHEAGYVCVSVYTKQNMCVCLQMGGLAQCVHFGLPVG